MPTMPASRRSCTSTAGLPPAETPHTIPHHPTLPPFPHMPAAAPSTYRDDAVRLSASAALLIRDTETIRNAVMMSLNYETLQEPTDLVARAGAVMKTRWAACSVDANTQHRAVCRKGACVAIGT